MDTPNRDLDFRIPNLDKPFLNMHIMSSEGEIATIQLRKGMSAEDLVDDYIKAFPKEVKKFLEYVKARNQGLYNASGMSEHGTIMAIASIPELIHIGMMYLYGADYWDKKGAVVRFVQKFPKLMIGDHRRKTTKGVIIK